jgi:hypothetical protein
MLGLTLQAIDGPLKGKTAFLGLNLWHSNPQTVEIANKVLSAITYVTIGANKGTIQFNDTSELHNIPFMVLASRQKDDPTRNEFRQFRDIRGNDPKGQPPATALQMAGAGGPGGAPQGGPAFAPPPQQAQQPPQAFQPPPGPQAAPAFQPPPNGGGFQPPPNPQMPPQQPNGWPQQAQQPPQQQQSQFAPPPGPGGFAPPPQQAPAFNAPQPQQAPAPSWAPPTGSGAPAPAWGPR